MNAYTFNAQAFALFVHTRREQLGLTITDAAKAAGVSRPQFFRAESGQPINVAGFLALCLWLGSNPYGFLLDEETGRCMARLPDNASVSRETGGTLGELRLRSRVA